MFQDFLQGLRYADLFTPTVWVYFVCLTYQHIKIRKKKKKIFLDMFCGSFHFQSVIYPALGFQWCMCMSLTSRYCSVSYCLVLCVVCALNSGAIQNEAC